MKNSIVKCYLRYHCTCIINCNFNCDQIWLPIYSSSHSSFVNFERAPKFVCIKMIPIPNHESDCPIRFCHHYRVAPIYLFFIPSKNVPPSPPSLIFNIFFSLLFSRRLMRELQWNLMKVCQNACGANRNGIVCAEIFTTLKMHL